MDERNVILRGKYDENYDKNPFDGNIALIGFMGTGKTTVCRELHDRYAMNIVDSDADLIRKSGKSIPEIFEQFGEAHFRDLESGILSSYAGLRRTVISCGGGAVLRDRNIETLRSFSKIVLLCASPETILSRVRDDDSRPKLRGHKNREDIAAMMAEREAQYKKAADIIIDTDGKTVPEICEEILQKVRRS